MTITLELAPELDAELGRQAARRGVAIDEYAVGLLEDAAHGRSLSDKPEISLPTADVIEAVDRLKSFGKTHGLSLGGMTIRELRHEARP